MLDIHTHILPGVDDGAGEWEDALEMAYIAMEAGSKGVVASAHGNIGDLTVRTYIRTLREFRRVLKEREIPLKVFSGMEVFMGPDVAEKLDRKELLTLNNSRYVLVEFDFWEEVWTANYYLECLEEAGYIPVIAHPERYTFVQKNPQEVFGWVMNGYVIQVNKGSFVGAFGRKEQNTAMSLLRHHLVHVIASDAHGTRHRTPDMGGTVWFLSEYIEEEYLDLLLEKNPRHILKDEEVENYPPIPYRRRRR